MKTSAYFTITPAGAAAQEARRLTGAVAGHGLGTSCPFGKGEAWDLNQIIGLAATWPSPAGPAAAAKIIYAVAHQGGVYVLSH